MDSPEKHLTTRVDAPEGPVEVHNIHTPPGSTVKMLKVDFWEAMLARVDAPTDAARILCGDFNSSWSEDEEDFVVGGGRRDPVEKARWTAVELGFLRQPELRDVYRYRHEAGVRSPCLTAAVAGAGQSTAAMTMSMPRPRNSTWANRAAATGSISSRRD